jgi:hypothetical protein
MARERPRGISTNVVDTFHWNSLKTKYSIPITMLSTFNALIAFYLRDRYIVSNTRMQSLHLFISQHFDFLKQTLFKIYPKTSELSNNNSKFIPNAANVTVLTRFTRRAHLKNENLLHWSHNLALLLKISAIFKFNNGREHRLWFIFS